MLQPQGYAARSSSPAGREKMLLLPACEILNAADTAFGEQQISRTQPEPTMPNMWLTDMEYHAETLEWYKWVVSVAEASAQKNGATILHTDDY